MDRDSQIDALVRSYITLLGVVRVMAEAKDRHTALRLGGIGLRDSIHDIRPCFEHNKALLAALDDCDEQMGKILRALGESVN